jgi:hypothetical protein
MNSKTELIFNKWTKVLANIVKQKDIVEKQSNVVANANAVLSNEEINLKNLENDEINLGNDLREAIKSEYGTK